MSDDVDLVILASQDSDLIPAIDEVLALGKAKVETFCWRRPGRHPAPLQPSDRTRRIWNTQLDESHFLNCLDRKPYE